MYNTSVVPMALEHIDQIMVIEKLSFDIPWSRNAFVEELTKNKFARYFAAIVGDMAVGYAGMWKICDEGHITNIAVHPEYRGNGIGSLLLEKVIDSCKAESITGLTLEVRRSNVVAQRLYGKYGFSVAGSRKAYYADNGEDALIMWKEGI